MSLRSGFGLLGGRDARGEQVGMGPRVFSPRWTQPQPYGRAWAFWGIGLPMWGMGAFLPSPTGLTRFTQGWVRE